MEKVSEKRQMGRAYSQACISSSSSKPDLSGLCEYTAEIPRLYVKRRHVVYLMHGLAVQPVFT